MCVGCLVKINTGFVCWLFSYLLDRLCWLSVFVYCDQKKKNFDGSDIAFASVLICFDGVWVEYSLVI